MKIIKKETNTDKTIYLLDDKVAMHIYAPNNKTRKDYICYLHDRVVPGVAKAKVEVEIVENPHKKTSASEKFGMMFRCSKPADAYKALTEICKCLPKTETPKTPKASATPKTQTASKKGKKKNELVFKEVKHEPANA
jgi:hypothetical protein